jgi:hypothetical protein
MCCGLRVRVVRATTESRAPFCPIGRECTSAWTELENEGASASLFAGIYILLQDRVGTNISSATCSFRTLLFITIIDFFLLRSFALFKIFI